MTSFRYEYNLGTRSFENAEDAADAMAWLKALFTEIDATALLDATQEAAEVSPVTRRLALREYFEEELVHWRIHKQSRQRLSFTFETPGSLGISLKPSALGASVLSVNLGGPADQAGLKANDVSFCFIQEHFF